MFSKKNKYLPISIASSFSIIFSVFLFKPIVLYVNNADDLWFNIFSLLIPAVLFSIVASIILAVILQLLSKFRKLYIIINVAILATDICFVLQSEILNLGYASLRLDGTQIDWSEYFMYGILSTAAWLVIFALAASLIIIFSNHWKNIITIGCICIFLVGVIVSTTVIITSDKKLNKSLYNVTTNGVYELSQKDNTVIFMLDTIDYAMYEKYISEHPETKEELNGFTEYSNVVTCGAYTNLALPCMLSGKMCSIEEDYHDYIDKIWSDNNVFELLNKNDVDCRLFIDNNYAGKGASSYIKNIEELNNNISYVPSILQTMYKLSLFNVSPHFLKQYIAFDTAELSPLVADNSYRIDDAEFYESYKNNNGFSYTNDYDNTVRFYQLNGAHIPYILNKDGVKENQKTSLEEQIEGSFNSISRMIKDMKENGVYDDSRIIILSDHGDYYLAQHSIILYKDKGATSPYKVDSSPISTYDISPTLASIVTGDYSLFGSGKTINDQTGIKTRTRTFTLGEMKLKYNTILEYSTNSTADDKEALRFCGYFHDPGLSPEKLKLNNTYYWTKSCKLNNNVVFNYESFSDDGAGLKGETANVVLPIDAEINEDINLSFEILEKYEDKKCRIFVNSKEMYYGYLDKTTFDFTVGKEDIKDNTLYMQFNFEDLESKPTKASTSSNETIVLHSVTLS